MEQDYIDRLNHAYDEFFSGGIEGSPVLALDTNALNIVQNPQHLRLIENRIREKLGLAPFQPSLPLNGAPAVQPARKAD